MNDHNLHIVYDHSHDDEQVNDHNLHIMYDHSHDDEQVKLLFFFFFFFYIHLTPHSPTGMAGGPIRTPTRGANYVQTERK